MMRARVVVALAAFTALVFAAACGSNTDAPSSDDAGALDASLDTTNPDDGGAGDAQPNDAADAADSHCLYVDGGLTYGCAAGGMGPGDRDDGGGIILPPSDASPEASDLLFGSQCLDNAQCRDGVCFVFKAKGLLCTRVCAGDSNCPPTSPGCNAQGVCRVVVQ